MKNTSTITLILLSFTLSIPQMVQAAIEGCSNKVTQITEIPLSAIAPASASDPRKNVNLDAGVSRVQELKSIAKVKLDGADNSVTGTLVGKCHVLVNLHIVAPYAIQRTSGKLTLREDVPVNASASESTTTLDKCSNQDIKLLSMTDSQLRNSLSFTVGFHPDGTNRRHNGFERLAQGKLILSGRDSIKPDPIVPEDEDWAIIQIPESQVGDLKPIEIASEKEILKVANGQKSRREGADQSAERVRPNALAAGYSRDLFMRDNKTGLYFQTCDIDSVSARFTQNNCMVTPGNSSAPVLIFPQGAGHPPKVAMIQRAGPPDGGSRFLPGVSASRFREKVNNLDRDFPCEN